MANRDLLKEAIADAKAVKETAIANAKAALEETFTPFLREKLAAKLAEIDEEDGESEIEEATKGNGGFSREERQTKDYSSIDKNVDDWSDDYPRKETKIPAYGEESGKLRKGAKLDEEGEHLSKIAKNGTDEGNEKEIDEIDLEELLKELEGLEEDGFGEFSSDGTEGFSADKDGETQHKALDEAEGEEGYEDKDADGIEDSEDEEIDIENMDEEDLKKYIESVIADMVAAGELEAGHEGMEGEEGEEGKEGEEGNEEGEIEMELSEEEDKMDESKEMEMEAMKKELEEAYAALETVKSELNEVNLLNAKLLYVNKVFKAKNLTESQKVKVLEAFDKAASVKEAKLVYETLNSNFAATAKKPMNESLIKGSASKPAGVAEKKPIMEADAQVLRMQKLAGIIK